MAAAAAATLVFAAIAFASTTSYSGKFATKGTLSFKLVQDANGAVRLSSLAFVKFPLSCDGGAKTETAKLDSSFKPLQPDFPNLYVIAAYTKPNHTKPLSTLVLRGKVGSEGASATGTMRIHGRKVPTDPPGSGGSDRCDSGKVHWSATAR